MVDLINPLKNLLEMIDKLQWEHKPDFDQIKNLPIITRSDLRKIKMEKQLFETKTSGSTGESLAIQKTKDDYVWYMATNIRELLWRKWDVTKDICAIKPNGKIENKTSWGLPKLLFPKQGNLYFYNYKTISEIQKWLEEKNPHYIHCLPSILKQIDLNKLTNLIDCKGTGEVGGSMYSSEECGTIAIQCPDNKEVYHVMENQLVEVDSDGGIIITTLSNPYIRRYKHGDHVELGSCHCGRTLQTIKKIHGRVRNMFVLPNGDKKWPLIGSLEFYSKFGIKRFKAIQKSLQELELQIISDPLGEKEKEVIQLIQKMLDCSIQVTLKYVESFPNYKFEEFVSLV
jgi:phenylacetate-CoA ligase